MKAKYIKAYFFLFLIMFSNYSLGEMCVFESEESSGLNKICYYSCPSGGAAITVNGYKLCPISIHK